MQRCETCGNAYDKIFKVHMHGKDHNFDSFECAIHLLAPRCNNCDIRIIGHGVENGPDMYCSAACARVHGVTGLKDHTDQDLHM